MARIIGFSAMWPKLNQYEFTTFRVPRKDRDWQIGERVHCVYHPRGKDHRSLFFADIVNVESKSFDPESAPIVTDSEAAADGFPNGVSEMRKWLEKSHGKFNPSIIFHKITLRRTSLL